MRLNVVSIFLIALCGCISFKDPKILSPYVNEGTSKNLQADLDFLYANDHTAHRAKLIPVLNTWTDEEKKKIKDYFYESKKVTTPTFNKELSSEITKSLVSGNYLKLEGVSIAPIIKTISKLSSKSFNLILDSLLNSKQCQPANLSFAFASVIEREFPDQEVFTKSYELYLKSYQCSDGELKARSAYRIAMFDLLNNSCIKASQYLSEVKDSEKAKYLFSRAAYWENYCSGKTVENKSDITNSFFRAYPLSYHSILNFKLFDDELSNFVLASSSPKVLLRTALDLNLNKLVDQIELSLDNEKKREAREYLSWLPSEKLNDLEPEFLLYLGYLAYLAEDGLTTFQTFSKVFSKGPQFKTRLTLKLFYPKWYFETIQKYSAAEQVDPLLILSLIRQESAFNAKATSKVGARGLMQIMPATARNIDKGIRKNDLFDSEKNIKTGINYFSKLLRKYDGNTVLALAAYNAGFGVVDKWVLRYKTADQVLFADLIPYRETREYVGSILRNYYWYQSLETEKNVIVPIIGQNDK